MRCGMVGVSRKVLLADPCGAYVCNGVGCHRGVSKEIKKLVIREDGTVLPEVTNLNHRFALGRIEDEPLEKLVTRYFEGGYDRSIIYVAKRIRKSSRLGSRLWCPRTRSLPKEVISRAQNQAGGVAVPWCGTCTSSNESEPVSAPSSA